MANPSRWDNLNPSSNIQSLGAGGFFGVYSAGGGGIPVARSDLDFMRMGVGRVPHAVYPDGYLGTVKSRRDDRGRPQSESERVLDSIKSRITEKSYQRGTHKGERIDPSDYYWPAALKPDRGIKNEMKGRKTAPAMNLTPAPHLVNNGKAFTVATEPGQVNPRRAEQWERLRPPWSRS